MEVTLNKKPQNVTIVHGFPGFGLVGTITTEFLIQHCKCELIGRTWFEDLPAAIAIHEGKIVHPVGIYYNEQYNMVVVHSITGGAGIEWKIADYLEKLGHELNASEFLSLEGVGTQETKENPEVYYYSSDEHRAKELEEKELKPLKEGVVMGVTSALALKTDRRMSALFVESHVEYPDSKASAELIKALDRILDLKVDPEPLYESAKKFEDSFNKILEQSKMTKDTIKQKQLNYVG